MIGIIARGAISALGDGDAAYETSAAMEHTRVTRDPALAQAGLRRPFAARAPLLAPGPIPTPAPAPGPAPDRAPAPAPGPAPDRAPAPDPAPGPAPGPDRATILLRRALTHCLAELDVVRPGWRRERVGCAIGTSSGGMLSFESFFDGGPPTLDATYAGPVAASLPVAAHAFAPASILFGACASSALAIGLGRAWLLDDRCDLVLAGGFDAVSVFVAAGFECLRATCGPGGPRPFRTGRDGLALGEAAAIVALARAPDRAHAWINGFGASCDATHLTAPDPNGGGLARAARQALLDAGDPAIGLVSAHGTATLQNDAAETAALGQLAATEPFHALKTAPVFSLKGTTGHTLGAAGVLEVLATVDALTRGTAPATAGEGAPEVHVLDHAAPSAARTALKLASAFGGANAALVVSLDPGSARATGTTPAGDVFVSAAVATGLEDTEVTRLSERTGYGADRLARGDDLVRLAVATVAALEDRHGGKGSLRGAGIVVGLGLATIETNARFLGKIRTAGAGRAEPRRFPYTTPNAAAGECAVAFGLDGPSFAVGGGPHGGIEAIAVAADLVRAGVIERVVVVAVDEAGEASARLAPGTRTGAVGLIVSRSPIHSADSGRLETWGVSFEQSKTASAAALPPMDAHRALMPLVSARPARITAQVPWGGEATLEFSWVT